MIRISTRPSAETTSGADTGDVFLLAAGQTENAALLLDQLHLREVLVRLPQLIGMNAIRQPLVTVATNNPGLEGYVPIDMSNITISTYSETGRVLVCVHSCQSFPVDIILHFVRESFRCTEVRSLLVKEASFATDTGVCTTVR